MDRSDIEQYVFRYLEATGCHVMERSPAHVRVKLSPEADKALTGRPFYWNFVERTGTAPETMSLVFVFDPDAYEAMKDRTPTRTPSAEATPSSASNASDSILGRYLGIASPVPNERIPVDSITYGSGRLQQIFHDVRQRGRYVILFEKHTDKPGDPNMNFINSGVSGLARNGAHQISTDRSPVYTPWMAVNYKVEWICDLKRDEIYSFGISLRNGQVMEDFQPYLQTLDLTPKLQAGSQLEPLIPLEHAAVELENVVEKKLIACDHTWADEAMERYYDEYRRIEAYYSQLQKDADLSEVESIRSEWSERVREIDRQFRPRLLVSVINCGIFHLLKDPIRQTNQLGDDTL